MPPPLSLRAGVSFAAYLASVALTTLYLLWALAPPRALAALRLDFLPARYWALVPPALLVVAVCSYGALYGALALALTPPPRAPSTLGDAFSRPPARRAAPRGAVPDFADVPAARIAAALFLRARADAGAPRVRAPEYAPW